MGGGRRGRDQLDSKDLFLKLKGLSQVFKYLNYTVVFFEVNSKSLEFCSRVDRITRV